jgi:hypothetical protein
MTWQPIETAPKDNTRIIVYAKGYTKNGVWGGIDGPWVGEVFWKDGWYGDKPGGWMIANCDEEYGCFVVATHWQSLPEPPMDEFDAYDVVKELRDAQDSPHWQRDSYKYMCKVAADEIVRLQCALKEISEMEEYDSYWYKESARKALGLGEDNG